MTKPPGDLGTDDSGFRIVGLLVFFSLVAFLRFAPFLLSPEPLGDELIYVEAMAAVAEDRSPYQGEYFYPPLFAVAGAALGQHAGERAVLWLLRLANTLGLAALLAASIWLWRSSWIHRAVIGAAILVFSPAVALGMEWGNLSLWAAGVTVPAVLGFRRHPWVSGLALSAVVAIKPLAAVALAVVVVDRWCIHRPWRRPGSKSSASEWALALVLIAIQLVALAMGARYLQDFLAQRTGWPEATRSVSVHRLFFLAGIELDALAVFVGVILLATAFVIWTHRHPTPEGGEASLRDAFLNRDQLLGAAVVASLLATPLVWAHTLLLALPIQILALGRLLERRPWVGEQGDGRFGGRGGFYEAAGVVLAILACHWVEGTGGIDDRSAAIQWTVQVLPAMSTPLLFAYLLWTRPADFKTGKKFLSI